MDGQLAKFAEPVLEFDRLEDGQFTYMPGVRIVHQFAGVEELSFEWIGHHEETSERFLVDDLFQSLAGFSQLSKVLVAQVLTN